MPAADSEPSSSAFPAGAGQFATTHWSVVLAAKEGDLRSVQDALETLESRRRKPQGKAQPRKRRGDLDLGSIP